ncbi:MAG: hypothetical protein ACYDCK_11615 [Thermoplasmatota archaeon]
MASLLFVGAALAGCIGKNPAPTQAIGANGALPPPPDVSADPNVPPANTTPITATVTADQTWLLPGGTANFSVSNVTGAHGTPHYEWLTSIIAPDEIAMQDQAMLSGNMAGMQMSGMSMSMEMMPHTHGPGSVDTGNITPGDQRTIIFQRLGDYWMHCHPHPWMGMNISVRPDGPTTPITVLIEEKDTSNPASWGFFPQNVSIGPANSIIVGPQTHITWINKGSMKHTATQMYWDPYLTSLGTGTSLSHTWPAAGNYRVMLKITDDANGFGLIRTNVYVDPMRPDPLVTKDYTGNFTFALSPATDSDPASQNGHASFKLDYDGVGAIKFNVVPPAPGAPTPADVTATFTDIASKKVLATVSTAKPDWTGIVPAGTYNVDVTSAQALDVKWEWKGAFTEKLVPPPGFHVHA